MRIMKFLGYKGLSITELLPYISGAKKGKVFGITFDDGYENNFTNALPILKKYGFTSSCFVVSNLIGKTNEWDQKLGAPTEKLMDHLQMQEWIKNNQEIGSHGKSHIDLTKAESIQIEDEIKIGRAHV